MRKAKEAKLETSNLAPTVSYETTSEEEEEDIIAQCKMIYEEYTSQTGLTNSQEKQTAEEAASAHKPEESNYEDARERKKWLAHEKSAGAKPLIQPVVRKTNHVQNAMQVSRLSSLFWAFSKNIEFGIVFSRSIVDKKSSDYNRKQLLQPPLLRRPRRGNEQRKN